MELSGSRRIAADRATVWTALNDPQVLKAAIPGCQEMTGNAEGGFAATVKQKVGPVSATFKGTVQLSNVVAGESYTITGEGQGGAAGFARGGADVRLEDAADGTLLSYDVKATVGGKLAQLGSRIIDPFARKLTDQFFENFKNAVEAPDAAPAAEPDTPEAPAASPNAPAEPPAAEGVAPASGPDGAHAARAEAAAADPPARDAPSLWGRIVIWFKSLGGGR